MRIATFVAIAILLPVTIYVTATSFLIPYDIADACDNALSQTDDPQTVVTVCGETLDLGITEQEVKDSYHRNVLRSSSRFILTPVKLVTPDDRSVRMIADCISRNTEGCTDLEKADTALKTVHDLVDYAYDRDLYGQEEFWACPVETLYLGRGDCEDSSILYASILTAMGLDCVLLDYPDHVAVGVALDNPPSMGTGHEMDGRMWWFCETTSDCRVVGESVGTNLSRLEYISHDPSLVMDAFATFTAWADHSVMRGVNILFHHSAL